MSPISGPFPMEGVFSVLPTCFHDDGALDLAGTTGLARAHLDAGAAGLTVLGVMGEAAELTEAERSKVMACAIAAGPTPIVVGVSGASPDVVTARSRDAAAGGASALMVSASKTLGLGAAVHAAAEGGLPIVIQDYPAGSGVVLTAAMILAVASGEPLVMAVKAEAPPTAGTIATIRGHSPGLSVMGGLGGLFLIEELRAGSTGVMTGFALPERLVSIVRTFPLDPLAAEREWLRMLPLMRFEAFQPFGLAARKQVWWLRGVIGSAFCRRQGAALDDESREAIRLAFERVTATEATTAP